MGFVYPLCMFVYHAISITNKKNLNFIFFREKYILIYVISLN